uniref:TSA: Wollemia nobilis Ref_Wollemi_Transcript_25919_1260 transcribed RNA sequence n=1 Tax=Wollemia nobilis TaxID=56998 RepID=A0A0C9S1A6_9CONI
MATSNVLCGSILDGCCQYTSSSLRIPIPSNVSNFSKCVKPKFTGGLVKRKGFYTISTPTRRIPSADDPRLSLLYALAYQEPRVSLLFALAAQTASQSQRIAQELASETLKYINPRRFEGSTLEEALIAGAVPDLETVPSKVLRTEKDYEIRQVQSFYVAETTMPGKRGFDFYGSSQAFNALAAYLFGKNTESEQMEMTTPVFVQKSQIDGEKMEMTMPVFTKQEQDQEKWQMSFVMPSKYGANLPVPNDPSIRIRNIPEKLVAVTTFSGYLTDEEVKLRESKLREALSKDPQVHVKENATVEVAQYNPPFTPPFMRRNEVSLEVEWNQDQVR